MGRCCYHQVLYVIAGEPVTADNMTPFMRDILSAAEGSSDLWLPAHGPSHSTANAMAAFGWIEAMPKGDRVYIQLTNAGRVAVASTA
jgi:hypothetical protein